MCTVQQQRKAVELTGQQFGRLVVLFRAGTKVYRRSSKPLWRCRCTCGNELEVLGQSLIQGKTVSCGCFMREYAATPKLNLAGSRFGRLTVVGRGEKRGREYSWDCLCDCGAAVSVRTGSLTSEHTTSCGCLRAERVLASTIKHGLSRTKEYVAMKARQRLERKLELDCGWTAEMNNALCTLQPACVVCGSSTNLAVDHVLPLSAGYGLKPGNAVRLCGSCNSKKHAKLLSFLAKDIREIIVKAAAEFCQHWEALACL